MAAVAAASAASRVPIKSVLLFCGRRSSSSSYATAAEAAAPALSSAVRKPVNSSTTTVSDGGAGKKREEFWMKDPKTGNWIPEAHFDDIDVAALREKFLPRGTPF